MGEVQFLPSYRQAPIVIPDISCGAKPTKTNTLCSHDRSLVSPAMLRINQGHRTVDNVGELRIRQINQQLEDKHEMDEVDRKSSILQS
jgi:hypothetical protein